MFYETNRQPNFKKLVLSNLPSLKDGIAELENKLERRNMKNILFEPNKSFN